RLETPRRDAVPALAAGWRWHCRDPELRRAASDFPAAPIPAAYWSSPRAAAPIPCCADATPIRRHQLPLQRPPPQPPVAANAHVAAALLRRARERAATDPASARPARR